MSDTPTPTPVPINLPGLLRVGCRVLLGERVVMVHRIWGSSFAYVCDDDTVGDAKLDVEGASLDTSAETSRFALVRYLMGKGHKRCETMLDGIGPLNAKQSALVLAWSAQSTAPLRGILGPWMTFSGETFRHLVHGNTAGSNISPAGQPYFQSRDVTVDPPLADKSWLVDGFALMSGDTIVLPGQPAPAPVGAVGPSPAAASGPAAFVATPPPPVAPGLPPGVAPPVVTGRLVASAVIPPVQFLMLPGFFGFTPAVPLADGSGVEYTVKIKAERYRQTDEQCEGVSYPKVFANLQDFVSFDVIDG